MAQLFVIVGMVICLAAGWIAGDWQRQRIAAAEQAQLRERAEMLSTSLVAAERRLTAAEAGRAQTRREVRTLVAASDLRECALPDPVAGLLDAQAEATRTRAHRGQAGAADVPGPAARSVPGGGSDAP